MMIRFLLPTINNRHTQLTKPREAALWYMYMCAIRLMQLRVFHIFSDNFSVSSSL